MANNGRKKNGSAAAIPWTGPPCDAIARMVDRFGWPGAMLILGYVFVEHHGSEEQKRLIIDTFLLGKGIEGSYPLLAMGIVFLLVLAAQSLFWRGRVKVMDAEIKRLSKWKSDHQEQSVDGQLHHTTVKAIK